jgi:hypothetical protein
LIAWGAVQKRSNGVTSLIVHSFRTGWGRDRNKKKELIKAKGIPFFAKNSIDRRPFP